MKTLLLAVVMAATMNAMANDPQIRVDDLKPGTANAPVVHENHGGVGAKVDDLAPAMSVPPVQAPLNNEEPPVSDPADYQRPEPHRCAPPAASCNHGSHGPNVIRETTRVISRTTTVRYVPTGITQLREMVSSLRDEILSLREQVNALRVELARRPTSEELKKQLKGLEDRLAKKIADEAETTRKLISAEALATRNHTSAEAEETRDAVDSQGLKIAAILVLALCLIAVAAAVAYSDNRQDPPQEEC